MAVIPIVTNYNEADSSTHYSQYLLESLPPQSVSDENSSPNIQIRTTISLVCGRRHKKWAGAIWLHIEMARIDEMLSCSKQRTGKVLGGIQDTRKDALHSFAAAARAI